MSLPAQDKETLRRLGARIAEIAALPIQQERRTLHERINNLQPARPRVSVSQEPWNELAEGGELDLLCTDPDCRSIELGFRQTLYKWDHYQDDDVIDGVYYQGPCVEDSGFGIDEDVDIVKTDEANAVVSRHFNVQIKDEADIQKIKMPRVVHNAALTEELFQKKCEIFEGIMPVKKCGMGGHWFAPWDEIVRWTGITEILMDMMERPDYVHKIIDRLVTAWMVRLDQQEQQGLLDRPPSQMWGHGAAQIFAAISPDMHEEFALRHEARWYSRFGQNYYGCCEPLDHKVDILRRNIPRLKKISMSPWVDFPRAVKNVGKEFVFAWKPNPAVLAADTWNPEAVRKDMIEKLTMARGCVTEIFMKDISTVRHQPQRLWEWAKIASEVTAEFA